MKKVLLYICSLLIVLFHVTGSIYAHERDLLYSKAPSTQMQELIRIIRNLHSDQIPLENLPSPNGYFVRIVQRRYVLTDKDEVLEKAVLGGWAKPFVFLTTPESIFGKSLLQIYADIGYEAEDIIRNQRNEDMVAILFRYPEHIRLSTVEHGKLDNDWPNRIYATTWDNILSLFTRLVQDEHSKLCKPTDEPSTRICLPKNKAEFVSTFSAKRKERVKERGYHRLQALGGPNWQYRKLLEDTLSVFEHFRGDGCTENELLEYRDKPGPPRLREVVAPNMKINSLPEVAIIHLGKLTIEDGYSANHEQLQKPRR
jgi:hypothetical protein